MTVIKHNKAQLYIILMFFILMVALSVVSFFYSDVYGEKYLLARAIFTVSGLLFLFGTLLIFRNMRLPFILKLEEDKLIYNSSRKRNIQIQYSHIDLVKLSENSKFIEIRLKPKLTQEDGSIFILISNIKGKAEEVLKIIDEKRTSSSSPPVS